jgi:hypothetical protein
MLSDEDFETVLNRTNSGDFSKFSVYTRCVMAVIKIAVLFHTSKRG